MMIFFKLWNKLKVQSAKERCWDDLGCPVILYILWLIFKIFYLKILK
jgi:hypothetical protein